MLIENPDAFKSWLTSVLEPLCDADPEALAKYVFALVKKDKAEDALRQGMLEQLDVFLQSETKPFVELLFKTIETQDYLMIPNTNPPNPNPPFAKKDPETLIVKDMKPIIPVSTLPNLSESINGNVTAKKPALADEPPPQTVVAPPIVAGTGGAVSKPRKSDSEKEEPPRRRRNRSRSRSWEPRGAKRSRSRERSPRRSRPWRNKSPPARRGGWRRSRSGSPPGTRLRSRSRSPHRGGYRGGAQRYRNRSPPRSPTRSRSRDKDKKEKDASKDENSGGATPTQDSNHGDTDMRLTSTTQSIQSVVSAAAAAAVGPAPPGGPGGAAELYKRRCRDFDEKGYCMRGEMCPYDHGVDPVVLEDTALTRVLAFGPNGAPLEPQHPLQGAHHPPRPIMEYNPSAPGMWHHRAGFRPRVMAMGPRGGTLPPTGPPFVPLPSMQRELINVPVTDMQGGPPHSGGFKRRAPPSHDFSQDNPNPPKRKQGNFDFTRLGPKNPTNSSLELKKVPRGLNNITHLNNHFSKFGKIINIQVNFEGDSEGALVTFSSHAEANAAYRSTEAVLNNRFIKVFWHSGTGGAERQENTPPIPQNVSQNAVAARPVKDRLGQLVNCNKVFNLVQPKAAAVAETGEEPSRGPEDEGPPQRDKSVYVPTNKSMQDSRALASAAIVKGQEILAAKEQLKKKHEEKRKEALKITQDLRKRKQELLEKQLAQQKLLIEKLEKTNPTGQQRELLMTTIKTVQESIESIRKDMLSSSIAPPASASPRGSTTPRKSKEEAQREVLDAELDLITRQAEGGDTSELQRRLAELRAQAQSLSRGGVALGPPRRGRGVAAGVRHRGGMHALHHPTRGALVLDRTKGGAGGPPGAKVHHVVDHRPTRVLVSGYESDESESVLAHFAQFGEISEYVTDNSTPSIILKYKTRKEAEVALLKGRNFQDRTLSVTWCSGAPRGVAPVQLVAPQPAPGAPLEGKVPESDTVIEKDEKDIGDKNDTKVEEVGEVKEDAEALEKDEGPAEAPPTPSNPEDQLLEGDDENVLGAEYTEEALLQDDEEEEETEDDRSWRR